MKVGRNLATCWQGLDFKRLKIKSMKRDVYADFNAEIYEVLNMDGTHTGFTAINYDDLVELCERKRLNLVGIYGIEDSDERPCRNCGCNCTELGGWYHELSEYGDEYHCDDCHDILYTEAEWAELCEENSDEFYWTE